jgi:hypothetical protein
MPRDEHDAPDIGEPDGLTDHEDEVIAPDALAEPGDKAFWVTYSPRFEMPISYTGSALLLASFVALLALILMFQGLSGKTKPGAQLGLVGDDAFGAGSAGSGGEPDPLVDGNNMPKPEDIREVLPTPDSLPQIREEMMKLFDDAQPISERKAAEFASLDQALKDKMFGAKKGAGGPGKQGTDGVGSGPGGTGSDSTRARSLRWIISFKTRDGRDYLNQLSAIGAVVVVPIPPEGKQQFIFRDLANPKPGTYCTPKDWEKLNSQIQFTDFMRKSVQDVSIALNLDFTPKNFVAYFPPEMEEKLSRMEKSYKNRRSEDIEETRFELIMRGGKYEMIVADQKLKR